MIASEVRVRFLGARRLAGLLSVFGGFSGMLVAEPQDGVVLAFREVSVSAAVAGNLAEIGVAEGDEVAVGAVLARIDSSAQELALARQTRILEKRRFDYEGLQSLLNDNMTSRDEAFEAQIEMEIAELDAKRAELELDRRVLTAPLAGLVAGVYFEAGEWVDPGTVVVELLEIDRVFAQVLLRAEACGHLELGAAVAVRFPALPEFEATGTIDFIDPRVDPASGLQRIKILVPNAAQRIRPGLSCIVDLPEPPAR